tara:strand:+ start:3392 stop:3745 length:354 start_codon:yes stop_codon:yes gene_type:complete
MANTFRLTTESGITSSLENIYTVPSSTTTIVLGIMLTNTTTSTVNASVQIVSTTATSENSGGENANESVYLVKDVPIHSSSSLEIMSGNKIVLQTTDILKASATAGCDILVSYMEIT